MLDQTINRLGNTDGASKVYRVARRGVGRRVRLHVTVEQTRPHRAT
jgi:hypothetical protein